MGLRSKMKKLKMVLEMPRGFLSNGLVRLSLFYRHSSASADEASVESICREMRIMTHTIEKALSLPKVKKGFGKEKVQTLLNLMEQYISLGVFEYDFDAFLNALGMICRYVREADRYDCDTSFVNLDKYKKWTNQINISNYGTLKYLYSSGGVLVN